MNNEEKRKEQTPEEGVGTHQSAGGPNATESGKPLKDSRLEEIEARYRALFDRSLHCVYIHDLEGSFLDVNEAGLSLLGYERSELMSLTLASILDRDQLSIADENMRWMLRSGSSMKTVDYRLKTKSGEYVWVETDASLLYTGGEPYAVQGVAKDITERKLAEKALKESEEKYRTVFDESRDAIYVTSREGEIIDANPAFLELFGYGKEELIGKTIAEELYADPGDRSKFQRRVEREGSIRDYEVRFRKKGGYEMDCRLSSTVRRTSEGDILGYQGIIRDVTEKKRAEKALRKSEAHYRAVVDAFDGLIYICSQDYRVEFMNQEFLNRSGYNAIGDACHKAIHGLDDVCPWCVNDRVFKGETVRWEVLSPKDNRWYYIVNTPIFHEDGAMSKQAMILDITDRKNMEEELKEHSERIKLFAYSVAHDLKSPAIGAYGFARRLHKHYNNVLDERGANYCRQIMSSTEQIATLAEQISGYVSAKESPLTIKSLGLKEIFKVVHDEFADRLQARGIRWMEPDNVPSIQADRLSVIRLLRNLVDNALKYGGDILSEITIGYSETREHYVLSVKDNGVGVREKDTEKIFGLFIRNKAPEGIHGTGLGLTIVKEIAERHKGSVSAEIASPSGLIFHVSLSKKLDVPD